MTSALAWLVTVEIIGLAAFPLAYFLLPRLADRGYGLSKALGILLIGYAAWILSVFHVLPSERAGLAGLVVLMAGVAAWIVYVHRREMLDFLKGNWRLIAVIELVFLVFLIGWTLFRAYDPAIDHTEQPMDFAFLNASIRSIFGQPEDPWLRGETISYYYFGYWMFGAVSELSGVASKISYNLSMALIPALASAGIVSVVLSLVRAEGASWRLGLASGVAAGVVLGIVSNLEGVLEFMRANAMGSQGFYDWIGIQGLSGPAETLSQSWHPEEYWWWFRATRVINTFQEGVGVDYTIQEIPFFSFMLGDLHPHVSAIPFALLFTAFVLNFVRADMLELRRLDWRGWCTVAIMGVSLGGLAFTNMWDLPTQAALLVGAAALKAYPRPSSQDESEQTVLDQLRRMAFAVVQAPAVVILLAIALYLPYYTGFTSSIEGVGAVVTPTRYLHMLIVWGVPLVLVAPFVVACFWQTNVGPDWRRMAALSMLVAFLPLVVWIVVRLQSADAIEGPITRGIHVLPLALLVGMGAWSALYEVNTRGVSGKAFALVLAILGLLMIMGPELLFVDDYFGVSNARMNTVFKLYYQAWVMLATVSGFAFYYWSTATDGTVGWRRLLTRLWAVGATVLIVGGLYYPAAAAASKSNDFSAEPTLDGLSFVRQRDLAEYDAIEFIKKNVPADAAIVEAVGEWFDAGLVSRSTGVPTVFNWPGHQIQWRGSSESFDGRQQDVETIYQTLDPLEARNLLAKYNVDYVYVGSRERQAHDGPGLGKFAEFMDTVFQQGEVTIYRVRK